jgi:hypothetical protein
MAGSSLIWPSLVHKNHWDKWVCELGTGCHLWVGAKTGNGRPAIDRPAKNPTRLICTEIYGSSDLQALHVPPCKNYLCINPEHLYWGSYLQNNKDRSNSEYLFVNFTGENYRVVIKRKWIGTFPTLNLALKARNVYLGSIHADIPD